MLKVLEAGKRGLGVRRGRRRGERSVVGSFMVVGVVADRVFEHGLYTPYYCGIIETWRCVILGKIRYEIERLIAFSPILFCNLSGLGSRT